MLAIIAARAVPALGHRVGALTRDAERLTAGMQAPPSTQSVWPVTNLASSLAKNTHGAGEVLGLERLFIAVIAVMPSMYMSGTIFFVASVIVTPGAMQLTVMFQLTELRGHELREADDAPLRDRL